MFRFSLAFLLAGTASAADKSNSRRLILGPGGTGECITRTIDFEQYSAGDTPSSLGPGVSVRGSSKKGSFPAMIFDTANPTGEDFDLASDTLGNVMIISEDGDQSDPDDAAEGGTLVFSFDSPVEILDIGIFDSEEPRSYITGTRPDGTQLQKKIPQGEDGENQIIKYGKKNIEELTVLFKGSGAVSFIDFVDCSGGGNVVVPDPTPAPTEDDNWAGSGGDPHFKKWNGRRFFFHGECDLMLLHSETFADSMGLDLHIRTAHRDVYSYIENAALRIGDSILEVTPGALVLDGKEFTDANLPLKISGYTINSPYQHKNAMAYKVDLNNGDAIIFRVYKFMLSIDVGGKTAADFADSTGLLGEYQTGEMLGRDGVTVIEDPVAFGMEWQVQGDEPRLFQDMEREPQLPHAICAMPAMDQRRRLKTFSDKERNAAQEACAGKTNDDFDFCVSDVLLTGDLGMAGAW